MQVHLWPWIGVLLQSVVAVLFAALSRTRIGHPLRKIFLALALGLFAHSIFRFVVAWHFGAAGVIVYEKKGQIDWMGTIVIAFIYNLIFWLWSWAMVSGSFFLYSCHRSSAGLTIDKTSLAGKALYGLIETGKGTSICSLSWTFSFLCLLAVLFFGIGTVGTILAGFVVFLFTSKDPRRYVQILYCIVDRVDEWEVVRLWGIPATLYLWIVALLGWGGHIVYSKIVPASMILALGVFVVALAIGYVHNKALATKRRPMSAPTTPSSPRSSLLAPVGHAIATGVAIGIEGITWPFRMAAAIKKNILCPLIKWEDK